MIGSGFEITPVTRETSAIAGARLRCTNARGSSTAAIMTVATIAFVLAVVLCAWYAKHRIGVRLNLTFLLLSILILVHGVPMLIYLHLTGPDTFIFEAALKSVDREVVQARVLLALALMFVCLVAGSELARLLFWRTHQRGQQALRLQGARPAVQSYDLAGLPRAWLWLLVIAMSLVSVIESQPTKVIEYFMSGGSEIEKLLLRREEGGTQFYLYNVVLYSVAPFLVMVAHRADRSRRGAGALGALAIALFAVVLLGKFATLSKAPPVIFLLQLLLLRMVVQRRSLNVVSVAKLVCAALALFSVVVSLTIPDLDLASVFVFLYYRVFDIPNESLIEYFSAIPAALPHGRGAGIFPLLFHSGMSEWIPTYSAVAEVTRDSLDSTSNVLFIGDAWAEFAWAGVAVFSVIAGFTVRSIDVYAFRRGHSDESACLVAGCAFGIFTMLSTALNTAMVTGGLALLPLLSVLLSRRRRRRRRIELPAPSFHRGAVP